MFSGKLASPFEVAEVSGVISEPGVFPEKFYLTSQDGKAFVISTPGAKFEWLRKGDKVKARIILSAKSEKSPIEASLQSVVKTSR
ncbi:MAG: hypothetical protein HQM08_02050 [Candidatus Riflebacteria bacterium]|nr:hypothetical protein [Candidatus Riflebacteria bacterium]